MYILDTAHQAGIPGQCIKVEDIGWDTQAKCFVNENKVPLSNLFRLYPYEWMVREKFGTNLIQQKKPTRFIEPPWKMILSNKGILPLLWEMFPNHPNLLPAYFTPHETLQDCYVKKPLYGREGENITFQCKDESFWTKGFYGGEGYIYQQYCPIVDFGGKRPIVGGWVVGGRATGIGIREDGWFPSHLPANDTWWCNIDCCVANTASSQSNIQASLNYACQNGIDCSPINSGGPYYEPNDLNHHASYAFNEWWATKGHSQGPAQGCNFEGAASYCASNCAGKV